MPHDTFDYYNSIEGSLRHQMKKSHFDGIAEIYDEAIPSHVALHYLERRRNLLEPLLGDGPVLDVGAGTGTIASLFAKKVSIIGVDFSFEMLRRAKPSIRRTHASGAALPFRSETFTLVYSVAMLHHLFDPDATVRVIKEMWRVTAHGGTIVIWDHNPLNPYWPFLMARVPQDDEPTRLVPLTEICEILRSCGANPIYNRWGWVPDFCPQWFLKTASCMEQCLERIPGLRKFSAHNVVTARKA